MNNEQITISPSYIALVYETRQAQIAYFHASVEAKKTKQGIAYQRAKDLLREAKALEVGLDTATASVMGSIHGTMTAEQAIAQMKLNLGEEVSRG
jgi:hypothetical protein